MVGIVVVSHSRALARAALALAEEMLQGRSVPIVIAAGLDEDTFGTDAVRIAEALVEADRLNDGAGSDGGVVVLMDMGSAVLSAELALELLDDDALRQRVLLCPAPLVEGLIAAAVTALSGAGRAEVAAEAVAALAGKQSQLGPAPVTVAVPAQLSHSDHETGRFHVTPEHGLHARPAARLVQTLQDLDARVELRNLTTDSGWVPGASLSRLATLGALRDHEMEVRATGPQAGRAVADLLGLAGRNFDEPVPEARPGFLGNPSAEVILEPAGGPFPASPGIGIGPARISTGGDLTLIPGLGRAAAPRLSNRSRNQIEDEEQNQDDESTDDPATARRRLDAAIDAVRTQLHQIRAQVAREISEDEAGIFDAHLALLADPELLTAARSRISAGQGSNSAWAGAVSVAAAGYESLTDPYQQARAADVRALGNQVALHLSGGGPATAAPHPPSVLVAADLTPAQAATLDPEQVIAVVLAYGSPSAHSTILVRARGVPAVVGAGPEVLRIAEGTLLALDGSTGELVVDPPAMVTARFRERAAAAQGRARQARALAGTSACTRDGIEVLVGANIGSLEEARAAAAGGADLIGLVRTEFLFLDRKTAPDVDEQEAVYRSLAEAVTGRRLTLRTLDVGGDKPLPYLPQPIEANPFLGVRGIRLGLRQPDLLAEQLLAVVRVAHDTPVSLMFPMISTLDEVLRARRLLEAAIKRDGRGEPPGLEVGIMIEVPAAALKAATLAAHVDFLSIGTNDLAQYCLAAERGNDAIAALADPLDPGVLRLIEATCRGAGPRTTVAVCGELAADEQAVALLVGLGVHELSVTPRAIPAIKQAIRAVSHPEELVAAALTAPSATAVRTLLHKA